uniref:Uncharacterized protein n=1 Tax=Amphimedon queenslandica TaxID=400682 RepID=A0A1X7TQJ7_AMPQE
VTSRAVCLCSFRSSVASSGLVSRSFGFLVKLLLC